MFFRNLRLPPNFVNFIFFFNITCFTSGTNDHSDNLDLSIQNFQFRTVTSELYFSTESIEVSILNWTLWAISPQHWGMDFISSQLVRDEFSIPSDNPKFLEFWKNMIKKNGHLTNSGVPRNSEKNLTFKKIEHLRN